MGKTIIFCADGTWNGPGHDNVDDPNAPFTNVYKLFLNLQGQDSPETTRLANEQERSFLNSGTTIQIAKYLHGVGDSNNALVKLLGGTFGAGTIARIVRGYTFISRNYRPGDQIILVGFSRGAYTARALGGLIVAKGLLDAARLNLGDKSNAYRLGSAVWYDYRRAVILGSGGSLLGKLEEVLSDLPAFLSFAPTPQLIADVPIAAIAVWDTVGSMGIPDYVGHDIGDLQRVDLFRFANTNLSPKVAAGFHALALDERRADFAPTLWTPRAGIVQVRFPGAHADVGGGYPHSGNESGLSDGAYKWMESRLRALGFVNVMAPPAITAIPDAGGVAHQPWTLPLWDFLPAATRDFGVPLGTAPPGLDADPSIDARMASPAVIAQPGQQPAPYRPINYPP